MAKQSLARPLPVLLTRPLEQGQGFAQRLADKFGAVVQPVLSPLMAPVFLAPDVPKVDFGGVIFTSSTGISAARRFSVDLPRLAYCVGRKTAEAALAAGFQAISADGDAEALLSLILSDPPKGQLLHLRGMEARGSIAEVLTAAGVPTVDLVVYRQDLLPLSTEAFGLLRAPGPVILPLFSPRSAALFVKTMPGDTRASLYLAALSPAVAEAAPIPQATLITAKRPSADAMLEAIAELIVAASPP